MVGDAAEADDSKQPRRRPLACMVIHTNPIHEVPELYRYPHILSGYRMVSTFSVALWSLFALHNQTVGCCAALQRMRQRAVSSAAPSPLSPDAASRHASVLQLNVWTHAAGSLCFALLTPRILQGAVALS